MPVMASLMSFLSSTGSTYPDLIRPKTSLKVRRSS